MLEPKVSAIFALGLVLAAIAVLPSLPNQAHSLWTLDGDLFMYSAQQWLHGEKLYADVAENKPPVVFIANAAGLMVGGGSPYGVSFAIWAAFAAYAIIFLGVSRRFGGCRGIIALSAVFVWLIHEKILNTVETFALPVHALLFALLIRETDDEQTVGRGFAAGILSSLLFFAKPNLSILGVIYFVLIFRRKSRHSLPVRLSAFAAGWTIVASAILALVATTSSIESMWEVAFRDAFVYTGSREWFWKVVFLPFATESMAVSSLFAIGLAVAVAMVVTNNPAKSLSKPLYLASLVFLAELIAASISGKLYAHYLVLALTPLAFLLAGGLEFIQLDHADAGLSKKALLASLATCMVAMGVFGGFHEYWKERKENPPELNLTRKIKQYVGEKDRIFIWSSFGLSPHFLVGAKPTTQYFTSMAILLLDDLKERRLARVRDDITSKKPPVVVDCLASNIPPLFTKTQAHFLPKDQNAGSITREAMDGFDAIGEQYVFREADPRARCAIYTRIE